MRNVLGKNTDDKVSLLKHPWAYLCEETGRSTGTLDWLILPNQSFFKLLCCVVFTISQCKRIQEKIDKQLKIFDQTLADAEENEGESEVKRKIY